MGEYGRLEIQLTQDKFACQRKVAQIPVTTTNILYIANLTAMNKKTVILRLRAIHTS